MVQSVRSASPNAVPDHVQSWANIGPALTVYLAGAVATLVAWCDETRSLLREAQPASREDVRRHVQALDWTALCVARGVGVDASFAVGGWSFSRGERDGRYTYLADPGLDPWQVEELCGRQLPSEWLAGLTGRDSWAPPVPAPIGRLTLASGRVVEIDPSKIPF